MVIKFNAMHAPKSPAIRPEIAATLTKTIAAPPATKVVTSDHHSVTTTFLTPAQPSQPSAGVEEDSTDIFTLERCSPLNDF